jgi:hypothetical protein
MGRKNAGHAVSFGASRLTGISISWDPSSGEESRGSKETTTPTLLTRVGILAERRRGRGIGEDRPLDDSHTYQTWETDSTNRSVDFNRNLS